MPDRVSMSALSANKFAVYMQTILRASGANSFAMKTIGDWVHEYMDAHSLNSTQMAERVSKADQSGRKKERDKQVSRPRLYLVQTKLF